MDPNIYSFLHVTSGMLLVAFTFAAFANPVPEARKRSLMLTGILSLVMAVAGFGLLAKVYPGAFPIWVIVKLVCWLGLSALAGIAFRRPGSVGALRWIAVALVATAVLMVYVVKDALG